MDRAKLIDKVVKLFRLGDASANDMEHEAMAAVTTARRIMAQHAITEFEVEQAARAANPAAPPPFTVHQHVAYTRKIREFAIYDFAVARCVETLTTTKALRYRSTVGGTYYCTMRFLGTETDAALASELFLTLLDSTRRAARRAYGSGWSPAHTSYALGFATRLADRAADEAIPEFTPQEQQTYALVLVSKRDAIANWVTANVSMEKKKKSRDVKVNPEAYYQGYADGGMLPLTKKVVR